MSKQPLTKRAERTLVSFNEERTDTSTLRRDRILSIEYPKDGEPRARKIISRSGARRRGKHPSWKMDRMVHYESPHEENAYRLLDANPSVVSFHEQPLVIRYILGGEEHRHFPDVLVNLVSTRELWEIKPASEASNPEVVARTRFLQSELPKKGFSYHMVIGEDLAREPRLSTALKLVKYGKEPISLVEREHVRRILERNGSIRWGAATTGMLGIRGRFILCRLVLEGYLELDFELPLCPETVFTPTSKGA